MSKRSADSKISYYENKIKKLKQKAATRTKRKRVVVYSSSSDAEENDVGASETTLEVPMPVQVPPPEELDNIEKVNESTAEEPMDQVQRESSELDPELLSALGDAADDRPAYGEMIHESLAQRWLPLLKKGLAKDVKEKILKEYQVPENCKLLKAPILNPEIKAAVSEIIINRDKNIQFKQDQLGLGITAMNKAMTLLLLGDDKVQAIKVLSDSCRILTDLHFTETQVRSKLIVPCLDKSFTPLIKDHERDEMLFGEKLSDTIKASKAIGRQGAMIKKPTQRALSSPAPTSGASTSKARYSGNSSGPSRYTSANRGGRAHPRASTAYRRPATTTRSRGSANQGKHNAHSRR